GQRDGGVLDEYLVGCGISDRCAGRGKRRRSSKARERAGADGSNQAPARAGSGGLVVAIEGHGCFFVMMICRGRAGRTTLAAVPATAMSERFFPRDAYFMRLALREAERALEHDDVPIGAVVVRDGEVLALAHNERELRQDPTAHAEIIALREAAR